MLITKSLKQRSIVFSTLLAVTVIGVYFWWHNSSRPISSQSLQKQEFIINKGEGVRDISSRLKQAGLIRDPIVFFLYVRQAGLGNKIQAGNYFLSQAMNTFEIAQELTHGTTDVWLTIIEGWRREEIGQEISSKFKVQSSKFMEVTNGWEGYLFPDTYRFPQAITMEALVKTISDNFKQKFNDLKQQVGNQSGLSEKAVIILASLLEREAKNDQDRPIVAGILLNRLRAGMALQVDATVQYAVSSERCQLFDNTCQWWSKVEAADLKIESAYNTYLNLGLPPTPIASPGLSSLKAALAPTAVDYWYYLSDSAGRMHYAKTLEEHNRNIELYLNH